LLILPAYKKEERREIAAFVMGWPDGQHRLLLIKQWAEWCIEIGYERDFEKVNDG
jgi:hypothetical protein